MTLYCIEKLKNMTEVLLPKKMSSNLRKIFTRSSDVQVISRAAQKKMKKMADDCRTKMATIL